MIQIVDDFLPDFPLWRDMADRARYADVTSPVDGVSYPGICDLPHLRDFFEALISSRFSADCHIKQLFMRLSLYGANPPHWAHHDASMGDWSLMVYLNRPEHCQGGTAILEHADGEPSQQVWERDTNSTEAWNVIDACPMQTNRACLFRSNLWHAAMPIDGFGNDARDGRLVLTAFFS